METTRKTWPGSTGTYSTQPETDTLAQLLAPRKLPGKPRPRVDRRVYPKFIEGDSTRAYVERYFKINTERSTMRFKSAGIHAYPDHVDHLAFYQPLSTARQYTPIDTIEETIE
jgi:hypothetical protein